MTRNISFLSLIILSICGGSAILFFSTCSSSFEPIVIPPPLLDHPVDIGLFPKSWIDPSVLPDYEKEDEDDETDEDTSELLNYEPLIGYILNSNKGNGEIVLSKYTFSSYEIEGEDSNDTEYLELVTPTFFALKDENEDDNESNVISIGHTLKHIEIDRNLKLAYILTYSPARLLIMDLVHQKAICDLGSGEVSSDSLFTCPYLPGLPANMEIIPQADVQSTLLVFNDQEHSEIIQYTVSKMEDGSIAPLSEPTQLLLEYQPTDIARYPKSNQLYIAHQEGVSVVTLPYKQESQINTHLFSETPKPIKQMAFSADGRYLYLLTKMDRQVIIFHVNEGNLTRDPRNITLCNYPMALYPTTIEKKDTSPVPGSSPAGRRIIFDIRFAIGKPRKKAVKKAKDPDLSHELENVQLPEQVVRSIDQTLAVVASDSIRETVRNLMITQEKFKLLQVKTKKAPLLRKQKQAAPKHWGQERGLWRRE